MPRLREWPDVAGERADKDFPIGFRSGQQGKRYVSPHEEDMREKCLGSGANGSAAPERSLGWRQGPALGRARDLEPATSALALT